MIQVRSFVLSGITPIPAIVSAFPEGADLRIEYPGANAEDIREMLGRVRASLRDVLSTVDAIPVRLVIETTAVAKRVPSLALVVAVLAALGRAPVLPHVVLGDADFHGRVQPTRGAFQSLRALTSGEYAIVAAGHAGEAAFASMAGGPLVKCAAVRTVRALAKVLEGAALGSSDVLEAFNVAPKTWTPGAPIAREGVLAPWQEQMIADTAKTSSALWTMEHGRGAPVLARRVLDALPALTEVEAAEITAIQSAARQLGDEGVARYRPFRAPHHTVSAGGLVGGGELVVSGEVTLAHGGILFLDEIAEFYLSAVEALRGALRDGSVTVLRRSERITFPARPLVVIARTMPCPCAKSPCTCSPERIQRYTERAARLCAAKHIDAAPLAA